MGFSRRGIPIVLRGVLIILRRVIFVRGLHSLSRALRLLHALSRKFLQRDLFNLLFTLPAVILVAIRGRHFVIFIFFLVGAQIFVLKIFIV